jgi:IS5 family transposase
MRHAVDRLSIRWFLGYDLNEPLPNHSSLTKIRTRYGIEVFRRLIAKYQHTDVLRDRKNGYAHDSI